MRHNFSPNAASHKERCELVLRNGPKLSVLVKNPTNNNKFMAIEALLDTGALSCIVDPLIPQQLGLSVTSQRTIHGVGGLPLPCNVFAGRLNVPEMDYSKIIEMMSPKKAQISHTMLLGRTFLKDFIVTIDGPRGILGIEKPKTETGLVQDDTELGDIY